MPKTKLLLILALALATLVTASPVVDTPPAAEEFATDLPPDGTDSTQPRDEFLVLLLNTADDEAFDSWSALPGGGRPTGIGVAGSRVVVTFAADEETTEAGYLIGRWERSEAIFQEWLNVEAEAVPVDVAASGGRLYLLFASSPGASGDFLLKEWNVLFGGWDEWLPADGGAPVGVAVEGDRAYILLRRAEDF